MNKINYENEKIINYHSIKNDVPKEIVKKDFDLLINYLCECATSNESISPTVEVDKLWHTFILHTKDYFDFCMTNFNKLIHHEPLKQSKLASVFKNINELSIADCADITP